MQKEVPESALSKGKHDIESGPETSPARSGDISQSEYYDELITLLQDMNWPISQSAASLLLEYPRFCVDPIHEIISKFGDDEQRISNIIRCGTKMPLDIKLNLRDDI